MNISNPIRREARRLENLCVICQSKKCRGCKQVVEIFGKKITVRMRDKEVLSVSK